MPLFRYSALDANTGKMLDGTVQADSAVQALGSLSSQGLKNVRIMSEVQQRMAPQPAPPAPAQQPVRPAPKPPAQQPARPAQPQARPASATSGPIVINRQPAAQTPLPVGQPVLVSQTVVHSSRGSNKELYFIFSAIADQLRAGISPANIFTELGRISPYNKYRRSFQEIAKEVSAGKPMSAAMETFPDLYPPHVTGMVRAGEAGGFLPDACSTISEQAFNAWKFQRFHWWVWMIYWNIALSLPLAFLLRSATGKAFDDAYYRANTDPGNMMRNYVQGIIWPYGPVTVLVLLGLWLLYRFWLSRSMTTIRHKFVLATPVLGGRARNESVTMFAWTLSKLSAGGLPANKAWSLAMDAVPNVGVKQKLVHSNQKLHEGSKISDAFFESKLFPEEYAPTVSTGELVGDVPGSLNRLTEVSRTEFEASTTKSKVINGSIGCSALLLTGGLIAAMFLYAFTADPAQKVFKDIDSGGTSQPDSP